MPLIRISVWRRRLDRDAFRNRIVHRVREAERQVQHLALHRGAEADADQLELLLVALGHARDHVREVRARGAGLHARGRRRSTYFTASCLVLLLDLTRRSSAAALRVPLAPLIVTALGGDRGRHALRQIDRLFATRDMDVISTLRQATMQSTSPPWPIERACLSVITPLRRRDDDGAHAAEHLRQLVLAAIDAQAGPADALEAVDDGPALVVLQADGQRRLAAVVCRRGSRRRSPRPSAPWRWPSSPSKTPGSLRSCRRSAPLRMRVRRSAMGSVMLMLRSSPARLRRGPGSRHDWRLRGSSRATGRTCGTRRASGP